MTTLTEDEKKAALEAFCKYHNTPEDVVEYSQLNPSTHPKPMEDFEAWLAAWAASKAAHSHAPQESKWIRTAERIPPHNTQVIGIYDDGSMETVEWREHRQCMLASVAPGAGEVGPGFISCDVQLPVSDVIYWTQTPFVKETKVSVQTETPAPLPCPEHSSYLSGCASCEDVIFARPRDCKHGQLARSCEICDLERQRDEARRERDALRIAAIRLRDDLKMRADIESGLYGDFRTVNASDSIWKSFCEAIESTNPNPGEAT